MSKMTSNCWRNVNLLGRFFFHRSENESNASFGQFFIKRSENLCEMLPNISPTRTGKPMALIDSMDTSKD